MTPRQVLRVVAVAALAVPLLGAQDALERARRALGAADHGIARTALLELLAAEQPSRDQAVSESIAVFRNAGATDLWLEAAERWTSAHQDDAMIHFYRGVTWHDLKHLRRADEALSRASALAPGNPTVAQYWALNAAFRFDPAVALERSRGTSFEGVDRFRSDQEARLAARPVAAPTLLGLLGLACVAAAVVVLHRV